MYGPPWVKQVDVVEVVEVERERRDHQRRHRDQQERQRHAAEDLAGAGRRRRAPPRSAPPGIDCSAPIETRKKYGVVSQTLTKHDGDPRPGDERDPADEVAAEEPRRMPADVAEDALVHHAEVVVQEAPPDEQRRGTRGSRRGSRPPSGRASGSAGPSCRARSRGTGRSRTRTARSSPRRRTSRRTPTGTASGRAGRGSSCEKFLKPTWVFQPGSSGSCLAPCVTNEPLPLSSEDLAVGLPA